MAAKNNFKKLHHHKNKMYKKTGEFVAKQKFKQWNRNLCNVSLITKSVSLVPIRDDKYEWFS